jgi:RNA polymerase sigma-70 factor (ECF subfamily)
MAARRADDGGLLLLHAEDRSRWDGAIAAEGFAALARSARGGGASRFHLEAGIAACHAAAPSFAATDRPAIASLRRAAGPAPLPRSSR